MKRDGRARIQSQFGPLQHVVAADSELNRFLSAVRRTLVNVCVSCHFDIAGLARRCGKLYVDGLCNINHDASQNCDTRTLVSYTNPTGFHGLSREQRIYLFLNLLDLVEAPSARAAVGSKR